MKDFVSRFKGLINKQNYSQLTLFTPSSSKIEDWCKTYMPGVVQELKDLEWDLSYEDTWFETVFLNVCVKWYDKRVGLYITTSAADFKLADKVFKTKAFAKFRKDFNLDVHAVILLHPVIFINANDLDVIYLSFDFDKGYSSLDYCHFDEEDNLDEAYVPEWGWLSFEENVLEGWSTVQIERAYANNDYEQI